MQARNLRLMEQKMHMSMPQHMDRHNQSFLDITTLENTATERYGAKQRY